VLNKYLLFQIVGSVFSTYQALQLLYRLSRKSRQLLLENQHVVFNLSARKHLAVRTQTGTSIRHLDKVPLLFLSTDLDL
jgi:hypothetical protein